MADKCFKGGKAELIEITSELEEFAIKAAKAVGTGVLGIDMMEDEKRWTSGS